MTFHNAGNICSKAHRCLVDFSPMGHGPLRTPSYCFPVIGCMKTSMCLMTGNTMGPSSNLDEISKKELYTRPPQTYPKSSLITSSGRLLSHPPCPLDFFLENFWFETIVFCIVLFNNIALTSVLHLTPHARRKITNKRNQKCTRSNFFHCSWAVRSWISETSVSSQSPRIWGKCFERAN